MSVPYRTPTAPLGSVAELKEGGTAGITVSAVVENGPLGKTAVMFTGVLETTARVVTLNVPEGAPPAMLKLPPAGTMATPVLLLIKVTVNPAGGAGPFRSSVPTEFAPPLTGLGLNVSEAMMAGFTVSMPLVLLAPSEAVTVTTACAATPTVVAVNICVALPAGTRTLGGTVTEGSPLLKTTVIPPVGAADAIVTVPVELVPPVTAEGVKLSPVTGIAGAIVTLPMTTVVLSVAVTVTGVRLATVPPVAM